MILLSALGSAQAQALEPSVEPIEKSVSLADYRRSARLARAGNWTGLVGAGTAAAGTAALLFATNGNGSTEVGVLGFLGIVGGAGAVFTGSAMLNVGVTQNARAGQELGYDLRSGSAVGWGGFAVSWLGPLGAVGMPISYIGGNLKLADHHRVTGLNPRAQVSVAPMLGRRKGVVVGLRF